MVIILKQKDEFHVRTLKEIDRDGRVVSTHIVNDFDALLRKYDLLPGKEEGKKKEGELIPFPK